MPYNPLSEAAAKKQLEESRTKGLEILKKRDAYPKGSTEWKQYNEEALPEYRKFQRAKLDLEIHKGRAEIEKLEAKRDGIRAKLPTTKDAALLKKQKEAEIQTKKTEAEQKALELKDKAVEDGKSKLKSFALSLIPFPPKLPLINPKILQAVAIAKQAKALIEERKKKSKENMKKNKEVYEYPLKPTTPTDASATKKEVPSIPTTTTPKPPPPVYKPPKTNYYVEIREQKNAWQAVVYLANPRSFQDTKFYSKSTYKTKQDAINGITTDAKSSGLVGLPPEPGFTFPGTQT
jgi:hypothetical protein